MPTFGKQKEEPCSRGAEGSKIKMLRPQGKEMRKGFPHQMHFDPFWPRNLSFFLKEKTTVSKTVKKTVWPVVQPTQYAPTTERVDFIYK